VGHLGQDGGMAKRGLIAAACLVLLVGCSSPEPGSAAPPVNEGAPSTIAPGSGGGGSKDGGAQGSKGSHDSKGGRAEAGGGSSTGDSGEGSTGATDSQDDGDSNGSGEGGAPGSTAADVSPYPAAGAYVYSQSGTEAFCDPAGNCDREKLPPTQKVSSAFESKSGDDAVVVQTARMSEGRLVRTTLHFTGEAAFVTDVYYRLQYNGFDLSEEYRPDPPVPSIRWPLADGKAWSASWSADTSGDYHARVAGVEAVPVGDSTVDAYRIETLTHFRGEYKGKASAVIWVDPDTKAIVATSGALDLSASYGSYNTTFETRLKTGPGY
jgi:hypothetical protein